MILSSMLRSSMTAGQTAAGGLLGMIVVGTPVMAIYQGTQMLHQYRTHYGNAPHPVLPQRGVVVAEGNSSSKQQQQAHRRPLHVLVIGDSLAAGVGMAESNTPALPEAIAYGLSHALEGRVVYWTCMGSPGTSASQIVADIQTINWQQEHTQWNKLRLLVKEWQAKRNTWIVQRNRNVNTESTLPEQDWQQEQERLQKQLDGWNDPARQENNNNKNNKKDDPPTSRIKEWFARTRSKVKGKVQDLQQDLADIKEIVQTPQTPEWREQQQDAVPKIPPPVVALQRNPSIPIETAHQYDIAVVLTGLNDVKDTYLPKFMVAGRNSSIREGTQRIVGGWTVQLRSILQALQTRMGLPPFQAQEEEEENDRVELEKKPTPNSSYSTEPFFKQEVLVRPTESKSSPKTKEALVPPSNGIDMTTTTATTTSMSTAHHGPLIVFPALPVAPLELFQVIPLKWFLIPIFESMDNHKRQLGQQFRDHVLFIEQPPLEFWEDVESSKNTTPRALLKMTDAAQQVRDQIQELMREYYATREASSPSSRTNESSHDPSSLEHHQTETNGNPRPHLRRSGSSLVAPDKIHPNDKGYRIWGQHIAAAIVEHWEQNPSSE